MTPSTDRQDESKEIPRGWKIIREKDRLKITIRFFGTLGCVGWFMLALLSVFYLGFASDLAGKILAVAQGTGDTAGVIGGIIGFGIFTYLFALFLFSRTIIEASRATGRLSTRGGPVPTPLSGEESCDMTAIRSIDKDEKTSQNMRVTSYVVACLADDEEFTIYITRAGWEADLVVEILREFLGL